MSKEHNQTKHSKDSHGSTQSYMFGFLLSLVLSIVPYHLVVSKSLSGRQLLVTILGFGLLQMLIQVFFFLHLGRGPKPLYNVVFFASTVGLIVVVVFGSVFIMDHLHYSMTPEEVTKKLAQGEGIYQVGGEQTGACQVKRENHKVVIKNDKLTPAHVDAQLCDTVTFVNEGDTEPNITFARYPAEGNYAGETNLKPTTTRSKTINLNQEGSFEFYDINNPTVTGSFTVLP